MGFFGKLFGSDKVVDAGISAIDAMVHTDEEKVKEKMAFLKLYEPYKIAQRYLAIIVCVPYMLFWIITGLSSFFVDVSAQLNMLTHSNIDTAVALILGFYFGGGAMEGIVKRFNKGGK